MKTGVVVVLLTVVVGFGTENRGDVADAMASVGDGASVARVAAA